MLALGFATTGAGRSADAPALKVLRHLRFETTYDSDSTIETKVSGLGGGPASGLANNDGPSRQRRFPVSVDIVAATSDGGLAADVTEEGTPKFRAGIAPGGIFYDHSVHVTEEEQALLKYLGRDFVKAQTLSAGTTWNDKTSGDNVTEETTYSVTSVDTDAKTLVLGIEGTSVATGVNAFTAAISGTMTYDLDKLVPLQFQISSRMTIVRGDRNATETSHISAKLVDDSFRTSAPRTGSDIDLTLPPAVVQGAFHAYFVFDVADTIDLGRLASVAGEGVARAPLQLRREASPSFIEFETQPIVARIPSPLANATARAKIFDYGVVSIRFTVPCSGDWESYASSLRRWRLDPALPDLARASLDPVLVEIAGALDEPHEPLVEDYFVFEVGAFAPATSASALLEVHADALASLVLCEERTLIPQERDETLRARFAYFDDDLTVVNWDTAFVYDRPDGAQATLDILEFANTQLAELRSYDRRLDTELDTIYALDPKRPTRRFGRRRAQEAADRLRYLIVDIAELTDRSSNALKIIGDAYYARLYRATASRLGLKDWQKQIDAKLATVNEMYRFFTDQAQAARSEFLEIVIVLLVAFEAIVGVFALHR